ncbi:MAG: ABC transporter ATP-binding protein [Andreesenia angusta]|nr:ABC transporter ATP-binding protein [Andreesenia angusta]
MELEIKDLKKSFDKKLIFENISMELKSGEIVGLVGRNGSGKTTLMQIIVTVLKQDSGDIYLNGVKLRDNFLELKNIIYIPDKFDYFKNYNILKIIDFYKYFYKDLDEEFCLKNIEDLGLDSKTNLGSLSKGQLTIVGTILGISTRAKFILIDEPYDGVDVINAKKMDELIVDAISEGRTVMISSHELSKLERFCDKIYLLKKNNADLFVTDDRKEIKKYQLVVNDKLNEIMASDENILIQNVLGRVYTILYKGNEEDFLKLASKNNIVQFDKLKTTIEDIMIWNNEKENRDERLS